MKKKLVVISIIFYLLPFYLSYNANNIATKAKDIAEKSLILTQKPRIAVESVKFKETDSYIFAKQIKGGVAIKVRFKIFNTGNSDARNVTISDIIVRGYEILNIYDPPSFILTETKAEISPSGPFVLAPQELRLAEVSFKSSVVDERAVIDMLKKIKNDTLEIPFAMEISYEGEPQIPVKEKLGLEMTLTSSFSKLKYSKK